MTDEYGTPQPGAPVPLPVPEGSPRPSPVPLGVPVRARSRWAIIAGIAVIILVMGACAGAYYLVTKAYESLSESSAQPMISPSVAFEGCALVGWSGSGRYAVIQYFDEGNVPSIAVWDHETETVQRQGGYVVVAVETLGAQIWLEPVDTVPDVFDSFSDPIDHKPAQLLAWRLDENVGPDDTPPAKWRSWPGPGGYIAYLELDPLKGCMPAKLLINNEAGSGEGVKAALPESTRTFAPVGWSPSGVYFAIEELADGNEMGMFGDPVVTGQPEQPDRRVIVFSAETGELVAQAVLPRGATQAPASVWGADDTLYWADMDGAVGESGGYAVPAIKTLALGDRVRPLDAVDTDVIGEVWAFTSLGSDESGALFRSDDGKLWRFDLMQTRHVGNLGYTESADWDARGGLLISRVDYEILDDDSEVNIPRVLLLDEHGGSERAIWSGPTVSTDVGMPL
jgi:hypothetical protein